MTDTVDQKHPEYECHLPDWQQCRDTSSGQRAVKERDGGFCYLPPTQGMWLDGGGPGAELFRALAKYSKGWRSYQSYLSRALFIPFIRDSADMILGMIWNKDPQITLPSNKKMDWVLEKVSPKGESLLQLMRQLCYEQIILGRAGLLLDLPKTLSLEDPRPYIALYKGDSIINWDTGDHDGPGESLNLVVLDESAPKREGFGWDVSAKKYRVLQLGALDTNEVTGTYTAGTYAQELNGLQFDPSQMSKPNIRKRGLEFIPFSFVGAVGNTSDVDDPPLLGLSDICLAIYRMQADYRQAMFMNCQDTLFTKGWTRKTDDPLRIGAGGHVHSDSPEGDMKYVGTSSLGLPEMRTALENDIKMANHKAGELMDASSRARESGTALEMRIGTKTATLNSIAMANAEGIQRELKFMAQWLGMSQASIDEIKVQPNKEFASKDFAAQDFMSIVQSKLLGGPISYQSIHKWAVDRGYTKLTWDQMMSEIDKEGTMMNGLMEAAKAESEATTPPPAVPAGPGNPKQMPGVTAKGGTPANTKTA